MIAAFMVYIVILSHNKPFIHGNNMRIYLEYKIKLTLQHIPLTIPASKWKKENEYWLRLGKYIGN